MDTKEIFQLILNNLREILPGVENDSVDHGSVLCLLGACSVERAELIEKTLEDLELNANRFEFHSANNLGELAEMFSEKINARSL